VEYLSLEERALADGDEALAASGSPPASWTDTAQADPGDTVLGIP
jgi:hypothetical protein